MNTMTTIKRFRMLACGLLGAVASSLPVLPAVADSFDAPQVTVKYEDLNISNPQGVATLYSRIRNAAKDVCSQYDHSGIDGAIRRNACMDRAIISAVTKVNSSAVYAVSGVKAGTDVPVRLVALSK